jgi:hypothetical protein
MEAPYYLSPDIEALSKEPSGGLMGWHELCVVRRQIEDGVDYNYARLAEELATHLGHAKKLLTTAEEAAAGLRNRAERAEAQLEPGSPTERYPTVWAYEQVCKALETTKAAAAGLREENEKLRGQLPPEGDGALLWALQRLDDYFHEGGHKAARANLRAVGHNLGFCLDDMGVDQIVPTDGICPLCDCNSAPHPEPPTPSACLRDCTACEKAEPWRAVFATEADYDASVKDTIEKIATGEIAYIHHVGDCACPLQHMTFETPEGTCCTECGGMQLPNDGASAPPVQGKEGGRDV